MRKAAFQSATGYADAGIKALGASSRWTEESTHDLCLELYNLSAESYFADGHIKHSKKRIGTIRRRCSSVRDRFRAFNLLLNILLAEEDYPGVISESYEGLKACGVKMPRNASMLSVIASLTQVRRLLKGRGPKDLEELPMMQNPEMAEACTLFCKLGRAAFFSGQENLMILCCLRLFETILRHGLNVHAPNAFAAYGVVLANLGDLKQAHAYGLLASSAAYRPEMEAGIGEGETVCHFFLFHLERPVLESRPLLSDAMQISFKHGDAYQAFLKTLV